MNEHEWETVNSVENTAKKSLTERLKIEGGYLYCVSFSDANFNNVIKTMCFVPDNPSIVVTLPTTALVGTQITVNKNNEPVTKEYVDSLVQTPFKMNKTVCIKCCKVLNQEEREAVRNNDEYKPSVCWRCWINEEGTL